MQSNQIVDLQRAYPQMRFADRDGSALAIPLPTSLCSGGAPASANAINYASLGDRPCPVLRIDLPHNFPVTAPLITISENLKHPWVDESGVVHMRLLDEWDSSSSSLTAVVRAIVDVFCKEQGAARDSGSNESYQHQNRLDSIKASLPRVPSEFPQLASLSPQELYEIITSKEKYMEMFNKIDFVSRLSATITSLHRECGAKAQRNLDVAPRLRELRNQIAIIKSSEFEAAKEAYKNAAEKQDVVVSRSSPASLCSRVFSASKFYEEQSETVIDQFLRGGDTTATAAMDVDTFIKDYMKLRHKAHELQIKCRIVKSNLSEKDAQAATTPGKKSGPGVMDQEMMVENKLTTLRI